jgi:hypothetical protein
MAKTILTATLPNGKNITRQTNHAYKFVGVVEKEVGYDLRKAQEQLAETQRRLRNQNTKLEFLKSDIDLLTLNVKVDRFFDFVNYPKSIFGADYHKFDSLSLILDDYDPHTQRKVRYTREELVAQQADQVASFEKYVAKDEATVAKLQTVNVPTYSELGWTSRADLATKFKDFGAGTKLLIIKVNA